MTKKTVKVNNNLLPAQLKKPRTDSTLKSPMDLSPVWHVSTLDIDGPWGWTTIQKDTFFDQILPKIKNFESMAWKDILGRSSHEVDVSKIGPAAQKRLVQLNLDDTEQLVSLHLSGKQRIWGIRVANTLRLLWWDPNHQVYPSKLRFT